MSNVGKDMIVAFFVISASYLQSPALLTAPGQQSRTFYTDITGVELLRISYGPAGLRSLPNEISGLSYALYGKTGSMREQVRRI